MFHGYGSSIAMSCGVGRKQGSHPALLWLWSRPAATTPIRPLPWEPTYASRCGPKKTKKKKKSMFHLSVHPIGALK